MFLCARLVGVSVWLLVCADRTSTRLEKLRTRFCVVFLNTRTRQAQEALARRMLATSCRLRGAFSFVVVFAAVARLSNFSVDDHVCLA